MQYRQGDVFIEEVDVIPKGAVRVRARNGLYVIAEGEATGHAHTIEEKYGELYEAGGVLYFKPSAASVIEHQEHRAIPLRKKPHRFLIQREWTDENEPRPVLD